MPRLPWPPDIDQLLEQFRVPGELEIYSLGCTEYRRVTMGSQQVRAINLIHTLAEKHLSDWRKGKQPNPGVRWPPYPGWHPRLLIIGGSAAGMTAAAYAAYRGAEVIIVEKQNEWMFHLKDSNRLLHPHLYEWGSPQPFDTDGSNDYWQGKWAGLPLLDWRSESAKDVREKLIKEWNLWTKFYERPGKAGANLHHTIISFLEISAEPNHENGAKSIPVSFRGNISSNLALKANTMTKTDALSMAIQGGVDAIILAVGLGVEKRLDGVANDHPSRDWLEAKEAAPYWQLSDIDPVTDHEKIIIIGNGDGALTDLFRYALRNFEQENLPSRIPQWDPGGHLQKRVLEIEEEWEESRQDEKKSAAADITMAQQYLNVSAPALDAWIRENLRKDVQIELAVRSPKLPVKTKPYSPAEIGSLCGGRAFPLNRLLLGALLRVTRSSKEPSISVVINNDDFPLNEGRLKEFQCDKTLKKWFVVFRAGLKKPSPIQNLLGKNHEGLEKLQKIHSSMDISRQSLWPFYGEEITPHALPANIAFLMSKTKFNEHRNAELFHGIKRFHLVSDAFDSTFQRALYDEAGVQSASRFFRGVMRFYSILYDKVYLPDSQVYDGAFFLDSKSFQTIADYERDVIGEIFIVRGRDLTVPKESYKGFLFGGNGNPKPFVSSYLGKQFNQLFLSFCSSHDQSKPYDSYDNFIRDLKAQPEIGEKLDEWHSSIQSFNRLPFFAHETWPDPGTTRFWNDKCQIENPARYIGGFEKEFQDIVLKLWSEHKNQSDRSLLRDALTSEASGMSAEDKIKIEQVRDWFDRAYNRMVTKNQGANVFGSVYNGELLDRDRELSVAGDVSIYKLGCLESAAFEKLHRKSRERREMRDPARNKPINPRPWEEAFEAIDSLIKETKIEADFPEILKSSQDHAVRKLVNFSSIESHRIGWVGDIDMQPLGSGFATQVVTGDQNGRSESANEHLLCNPSP